MRDIIFIIVKNSDKSIVTCPITDLKDAPYLFTKKKKIVCTFRCFEGRDKQHYALAHAIHQTYVYLKEKKLHKHFANNINNCGFNSSLKWHFSARTMDLYPIFND